jgi:putative ABC transport system ATP-binding protein
LPLRWRLRRPVIGANTAQQSAMLALVDVAAAAAAERFGEIADALRTAARGLARTPGFTIIAAGTLALALAANVAMFAVLDGVALRPLPFANSGRLVSIGSLSVKSPDARKLEKRYQTDTVETYALAGVSLQIAEGEFVSIEGPSGCGKSTLLAVMGLLDAPTSGTYALRGRAVAELDSAERARVRNREIGFIFQNFNLIGDLSVRENVELPLAYRGLSRGERRRRAAEALERVAMSHRAEHAPAQLSGGQQQRVAVARALAIQPAVLLADEPTGNLDSQNGEAVIGLLRELHADGSTIVMVTHDPRYAGIAQRTIHMLDGKLVGAGDGTGTSRGSGALSLNV